MAELISFDHPILSRRLPCKPHPISLLPDELVREILRWLPVKSLMQFKCVSRIWLSIITDPSFAAVYRGGFRGLLLSHPFFRLVKERRFFYASLDFEFDGRCSYQFSRQFIIDHGGKAMGCTEILNGLLCFYYREYSCLFNPATLEELQLPSSAVDPDPSKSQDCSYHFGFDPVNKLYKLLKICPVYDGPDEDRYWEYRDMDFVENLNCEILTIGVDSSCCFSSC